MSVFYLATDAFDQSWLYVLSAESQYAWVRLLSYIARRGFDDRAPVLTLREASASWGVEQASVEKMLKAAERANALTIGGQFWVYTGIEAVLDPGSE